MNRQNTTSRFIVFFLSGALILVGCQPQAGATSSPQNQSPTAASTASGGPASTLISAQISLDPAVTQDADSLVVCAYLYDGLVRLDSGGSAQPALAASWVVSDDQLDYIFTLRTGLKFSDGSAITPDIVVDNFNRWFDKEDPLHKSGDFKTWETIFLGFNGEKDENKRPVSPVDGIQKVDLDTIIIHLNRPVPELITNLANPAFAILNTDALASADYGGQGSTIISSGPYLVASWTNSGLTLSPNPNYWGEIPAIDLQFGFK